MPPLPALYAAFLYGANIPHGRKFTRESARAGLRRLQPTVTLLGIVRRPDSILLRCGDDVTEDSVRRAVTECLDCPSVVVSVETLERLVESSLDTLRSHAYHACPPYRISVEGAEWEWCLVFCSEPLPPQAGGDTWLFAPTRNAVALTIVGRRALLARKRRETARGGRIMLGAALIDPWLPVLEQKGVPLACLTSRTLNQAAAVVSGAKALTASLRASWFNP